VPPCADGGARDGTGAGATAGGAAAGGALRGTTVGGALRGTTAGVDGRIGCTVVCAGGGDARTGAGVACT
jgi:hypothetical protein